eukprot:scaffold12733_cov74-Cyclotella_meneghiniana.AAC.11
MATVLTGLVPAIEYASSVLHLQIRSLSCNMSRPHDRNNVERTAIIVDVPSNQKGTIIGID